MSFGLTDSVECEWCGATKTSSDMDCAKCSEFDRTTYHFDNISTEKTITIHAVNDRKWHDLIELVDEPLLWRCRETGAMAADLYAMGIDIKEIWEEVNDES